MIVCSKYVLRFSNLKIGTDLKTLKLKFNVHGLGTEFLHSSS